MHCLGVKQAARVLSVEGGNLSESGFSSVRLRFVHFSEALIPNSPCVFREGSGGAHKMGVAVGVVTGTGAGAGTGAVV